MTRKSITLAAVALVVAALGFGWATAQTKTADPKLTAQDYFEIQMLYGRYTHAIDHGDKDGMDYAGTFLPEIGRASGRERVYPCRVGQGWEGATRDDIRDSITDVKKVDGCVMKMIGTQKLARLA